MDLVNLLPPENENKKIRNNQTNTTPLVLADIPQTNMKLTAQYSHFIITRYVKKDKRQKKQKLNQKMLNFCLLKRFYTLVFHKGLSLAFFIP